MHAFVRSLAVIAALTASGRAADAPAPKELSAREAQELLQLLQAGRFQMTGQDATEIARLELLLAQIAQQQEQKK